MTAPSLERNAGAPRRLLDRLPVKLAIYEKKRVGRFGVLSLRRIGWKRADSLWSVDSFRCESILLKSYWVLVVMDVFTRGIVGFGVEAGFIDGISVCRMFGAAICGKALLKRVSTDHDPLYRFHRWLASLITIATHSLVQCLELLRAPVRLAQPRRPAFRC